MPIGTSDGEYFDNHFEAMVEGNTRKAEEFAAGRPRVYITGNSELEDRRHQTTTTVDMPSKFEQQVGVSPEEFFFDYPRSSRTRNPVAKSLGYEDIRQPGPVEALEFVNQVESMNDPWKGGQIPTDQIKLMQDRIEPFFSKIPPNLEPPKPREETGVPFASGMPLGSPEKPAGALNSEEATGVAPSVSEENKGPIRPEPYGLNPPDKDFHETVKDLLFGKGENDIRPALGNFYEHAKKAFKLPGDVYGGKIDPMSPQGIERAFDLASFAVLGPAPVAAKIADGTLGSFAGVKARTTKSKLSDLGFAQVLESAGEHPDVIWKKTGFARGAEGRWRHEIDDSKSILKETWADNPTATEKQTGFRVRKLPEVLDHPELYEAYPHLKNVQIVYDKTYEGLAQWDGAAITIGNKAFKDKGIIMHEVQHAIQDYEGFAKGGSPAKTGEYAKDAAAYNHYRRLAGEVESNNTETRLLLTEKERRSMAPWWTEDVKRREQIVSKRSSEATHEGVFDPVLNRMMKSTEKPTDFRRPANDNNPPRTIEELQKVHDELKASQIKANERLKKMKELDKQIEEINKKPQTEFQTARLEKLHKEWEKLWDDIE